MRDAVMGALFRYFGTKDFRPMEPREPLSRWYPISQRVETTKSGRTRTVTRIADRRWHKPHEHDGWRNGLGTNLMKRHLAGRP